MKSNIIIKTDEEIALMREAGKRHGKVLKQVADAIRPGMSTKDVDDLTHKLIVDAGDIPAFLNYKPEWAKKPFPGAICVSVNDEIVHGIPSATKILKEGDLVKIDIGYCHKGVFTDAAVTVGVGAIDEVSKKLIKNTRDALYAGIDAAKMGDRIGDIGNAIENVWKRTGFSIPRNLSGHGVGRYIHEDPYVLNEGRKGSGELLREGMTIAIEPQLNEGTGEMITEKNDHVCRTADGKRSAHFEHTVLITKNGPEILTELP